MTPAPGPRPALAVSNPLRLADQPEAASPDKQGRTGCLLPAGIEPLLGIDDLAAILRCSRRLVERMRSAGKVPKPDIKIGKMPRWKAATIQAWIERGGRA